MREGISSIRTKYRHSSFKDKFIPTYCRVQFVMVIEFVNFRNINSILLNLFLEYCFGKMLNVRLDLHWITFLISFNWRCNFIYYFHNIYWIDFTPKYHILECFQFHAFVTDILFYYEIIKQKENLNANNEIDLYLNKAKLTQYESYLYLKPNIKLYTIVLLLLLLLAVIRNVNK